MTPRRLGPDDPSLPAVQRLIAAAFPAGSGAPSAELGRDDLNAMVEAGPALVIEVEGVPKACLFSRPSNFQPGALYIGTLVVTPSLRGTGKAGQLIAAMTEEARLEGFTGLVVAIDNAEEVLVAFFENLGFRGFRDGTGCLAMSRPVSD